MSESFTFLVGPKNLRYTAYAELKSIPAIGHLPDINLVTKGSIRNHQGKVFSLKLCSNKDIQKLKTQPHMLDKPSCSYGYIAGDVAVFYFVEGQSRWGFSVSDGPGPLGRVENIHNGGLQAQFSVR